MTIPRSLYETVYSNFWDEVASYLTPKEQKKAGIPKAIRQFTLHKQIMALDRVEDRTKKLAFVVPVTYSEFNNKFSYTIELKGHVVSMYEIDNAHKLFNKETKLVYADSNGYLSTID